jgi:hypothetical protein
MSSRSRVIAWGVVENLVERFLGELHICFLAPSLIRYFIGTRGGLVAEFQVGGANRREAGQTAKEC